MSTPASALIHFRLSRSEIKLIRIGVFRLVAEHELWERQGRDLCSAYRKFYFLVLIDEGEYSAADMARIVAVFSKLREVRGATKRLHMDVLELAVCMLGVRTTQMRVRHGHMQPWLPDHRAATRALLRKLERLRKRAKRRFIRVCGLAAYQAAHHRWQRFTPFLRAYFLFCPYHHPLIREPQHRRVRRLLQQDWMKRFREDLPQLGIEVPPEAELLDLTKRALRAGRRFIKRYGLIFVSMHRELALECVWNFVVKRCRKTEE